METQIKASGVMDGTEEFARSMSFDGVVSEAAGGADLLARSVADLSAAASKSVATQAAAMALLLAQVGEQQPTFTSGALSPDATVGPLPAPTPTALATASTLPSPVPSSFETGTPSASPSPTTTPSPSHTGDPTPARTPSPGLSGNAGTSPSPAGSGARRLGGILSAAARGVRPEDVAGLAARSPVR